MRLSKAATHAGRLCWKAFSACERRYLGRFNPGHSKHAVAGFCLSGQTANGLMTDVQSDQAMEEMDIEMAKLQEVMER